MISAKLLIFLGKIYLHSPAGRPVGGAKCLKSQGAGGSAEFNLKLKIQFGFA